MTSPTFDISGYSTIDIDFSFYPKSMENNEDFWVRYYDGNSWQTIATFTRGVDFNNNIFYTTNVSINNVDYNFPTNAQFRFQCDASGNKDYIYIDAVTLTADADNNSALMASNDVELHSIENQFDKVEDHSTDTNIEEVIVEDKFNTVSTLVSVYPNPANSYINIDLGSTDSQIIQMGIVDIMGREVMPVSTDSNFQIIQKDISHLANGLYFLRVLKSKKEVQMIKFYIRN